MEAIDDLWCLIIPLDCRYRYIGMHSRRLEDGMQNLSDKPILTVMQSLLNLTSWRWLSIFILCLMMTWRLISVMTHWLFLLLITFITLILKWLKCTLRPLFGTLVVASFLPVIISFSRCTYTTIHSVSWFTNSLGRQGSLTSSSYHSTPFMLSRWRARWPFLWCSHPLDTGDSILTASDTDERVADDIAGPFLQWPLHSVSSVPTNSLHCVLIVDSFAGVLESFRLDPHTLWLGLTRYFSFDLDPTVRWWKPLSLTDDSTFIGEYNHSTVWNDWLCYTFTPRCDHWWNLTVVRRRTLPVLSLTFCYLTYISAGEGALSTSFASSPLCVVLFPGRRLAPGLQWYHSLWCPLEARWPLLHWCSNSHSNVARSLAIWLWLGVAIWLGLVFILRGLCAGWCIYLGLFTFACHSAHSFSLKW